MIWRRLLVRTDSTLAVLHEAKKFLKTAGEFRHYIEVNLGGISDYGDWYRHGEVIASSFVESTVNPVVSKRMVKKQQMRWTEWGPIGCCRSAPES